MPVFYAVTILILTIWSLNKGLTLSDEGWYLFLLKDMPSGVFATSYYKLFFNLFDGDILNIRIGTLVMMLTGCVTMAGGLFLYFRRKLCLSSFDFLIITALTITGFSFHAIKVSFVFSYLNINSFLTMMSVGLMLAAFELKKPKSLLLFLSGVFIGIIPFVMITNSLIIPALFILLAVHPRKVYWQLSVWTAGIIAAFVLFFSLIESPQEFFLNILSPNLQNAGEKGFEAGYGIRPLLFWLYQTITHLAFYIILPAILIFKAMVKAPFPEKASDHWLMTGLLPVVFILFFIGQVVFREEKIAVFAPFMIFFLVAALIYFRSGTIQNESINKPTKQEIILCIALFLMPVLLSFVTLVEFRIRGGGYMNFVLPMIYLFGYKTLENKKVYMYFLLACIPFILHFMITPARSNWGGVVYINQNVPLKKLGLQQNLLLDKGKTETLVILQQLTRPGDKVILSAPGLWGYAYLLDLQPVSYEFRFDENKTIDKLKQNIFTGQTIILFQHTGTPFPDSFLRRLETFTGNPLQFTRINPYFEVAILDNDKKKTD